MSKRILLLITLIISLTTGSQAQKLDHSWQGIITSEPDEWYGSDEAQRIADNVLLYQRDIGGWPKNIQMQKPLSKDEKEKLLQLKNDPKGCTTDNGATVQEMLYLSKVYKHVPDERYKEAFLKGLNYLLEAQYNNGGWPQFYPVPPKGYYSHITYNDDSMVNIMRLLEAIMNQTGYYSITPDQQTIEKAKIAFDKGVECILKTQYKQNGVLTAWCAQHDENTFEPAKARAYELPSLSGKESAQIVLLLMSIQHPSQAVINAVEHAVAWFEKSKIEGIRVDRTYGANGKVTNKVVIKDASAPPLWARFMNLDDNTPFFCDRDGIKKATLAEIGSERRNGYRWYTDEPAEVLKKYPEWKARVSAQTKTTKKADQYYMVVAKDGSGDYTSIQEAIDNAKAFPYQRVVIYIKNGVYYEKVKVHEWNPNISLIGESKEKTIITYDDNFKKLNLGRNSTFYTYTVLVEGDNFYAANLTIQNTSGAVGQAVALAVTGTHAVIYNCRILGNQDTLYASGEGKQYYKECYIEGTTDFIFGNATAFFEGCTIHSKGDSYITAASTPKGAAYGYVFDHCHLTADAGVNKVYLGRPWRFYAKTVFLNCEEDTHIVPAGWHNWSKPEAEKDAYYAEYNCYGKGAATDKRANWAHQLTKKEAKDYTIDRVLGDKSGKAWYLIDNYNEKK